MQAIILAAGMGKSLRELTKEQAKCMIEVSGVSLIERMLHELEELPLERIVVVVGFQKEKLVSFIETLNIKKPIVFVENENYETTNNIYSLYCAREYLAEDDSLLLESDSILEKSVLEGILQNANQRVAVVARPRRWMNGAFVSLDKDLRVEAFITADNYRYAQQGDYYKTANIAKFDKEFLVKCYIPYLQAYCSAWTNNSQYESILKVIPLQDKMLIHAHILKDELWYAINDIQDIDIAESIFAKGEEKLRLYMKRYGGYWRYPKMLDYCYIVNPYFPNERFMDEMKANFDVLVRDYPSGMGVNSLLAAKYFGLRSEQIVVGNGTAELIKSFMEQMKGKVGMIYPTFEEYPNRLKKEQIVPFPALTEDFMYNVDDLMNYYDDKDVEAVIVVNPDNPSGHFIIKDDLIRMAAWAEKKGCQLVVDESFVDFADCEESQTLLEQEILDKFTTLIVLKSISKSFGVPGLRLGILATQNTKLIEYIKKDVAIWNINSFAEYYMQIIEKYKEDYEMAMDMFRESRKRYIEKLNQIKQLRIFPTQANYVLCEVQGGMTSTTLADKLLNEHNILIKDLSKKEGFKGKHYIRLSVKDDKENDQMICALRSVFQ